MLFSVFLRVHLVTKNSSKPLFYVRSLKDVMGCRNLSGSIADHHNIKKLKLVKRLASTVLFGGTFLTVLWARKRKKSLAFEEAKLMPLNLNYHKNFKLYEYKGFILPSFAMKNMDRVQKFTFRENDIVVASFPKTGTTWLQEIIYCILKGIDKTSSTGIEERFPYLEFIYPGLATIEKNPDQRFIKTHLPYSLLPKDVHKKNPKILYIMRNPKDVVVSYYHFVRMMTITNYIGTFENFFEEFLADKIPYGPIWKHYAEIWEHRKETNVLILHYEDFHKDIRENVRKIAKFLDVNLTDNEVENIVEHCSFSSMSENPSVNYQHWDDLGIRKKDEAKFMRKGEVGDWKNYFSPDMNHAMDLWIDEHFKGTDIFSYELLAK